jgi:hypothetical protein
MPDLSNESIFGDLAMQKVSAQMIPAGATEGLEAIFAGVNWGVWGRQPPSPNPGIPPYLLWFISMWSNNDGCAANCLGIANGNKWYKDLRTNPKVPLSVRQGGTVAIKIWLSIKLYICYWNKYKVWIPTKGIKTWETFEKLWPCKYDLMKELGIDETILVTGWIPPWRNRRRTIPKGIRLPPEIEEWIRDTGGVGNVPRYAADPWKCCKGPESIGCQVSLGVGFQIKHIVTGVIISCDPMIIRMEESPLQGFQGQPYFYDLIIEDCVEGKATCVTVGDVQFPAGMSQERRKLLTDMLEVRWMGLINADTGERVHQGWGGLWITGCQPLTEVICWDC